MDDAMVRGSHMSGWRILGWGGAAALLLLPAIAMQFPGSGVSWTASDFIFMALMTGGGNLAFELIARQSSCWTYRLGAAIALALIFLLVVIDGAVGIIGDEHNRANLMFLGVIAVAIGGAVAARFKPLGMARAMMATAGVQLLVGLVALAGQFGTGAPSWPWDVIGLTGAFTAAWLGAAWLFRKAA